MLLLALPSVLLGLLGVMVLAEVRGLSRWGSRRLLEFAVRRIPPGPLRDERDEEWQAQFEDLGDAAIARIVWVLGLILAGVTIGRRERRQPTVHPEEPEKPKHVVVTLSDVSGVVDEVFLPLTGSLTATATATAAVGGVDLSGRGRLAAGPPAGTPGLGVTRPAR